MFPSSTFCCMESKSGTLTLVQGTQTLCTNEVDGHHCSRKSRRLDAGSPERQPGSAQASDQTARDGPS